MPVAIILISAFLSFDFFSYSRVIHPGIRLGGVAVGGQPKKIALVRIRSRAAQYLKKPIVFRRNRDSISIFPGELGVSIDFGRSVGDAYGYEKKPGFIKSIPVRIVLLFRGEDIPLRVALDRDILAKGIKRINGWIDHPPKDATVIKREGDLVVEPSGSGVSIDRSFLIDKIKEEAGSLTVAPIDVTTRVWKPHISDEEAAKAAENAKSDCSSPLAIKYGRRGMKFEEDQLWEFLTFEKVTNSRGQILLAPSLERMDIIKRLVDFLSDFNEGAVDARFAVDGSDVSIVPGKDGRVVDLSASYSRLIEKFRSSKSDRTAFAKMRIDKPKVTSRDLASMHVETRLSSYTTNFDSSKTPRVNNIARVAEQLDGTLIAPGEVFSFNEITGPRTKEKGYKEAPVIVRGVLKPGVGGGVCQVGTTVFNAAFFAGLPFIERHPHYFYISHYPPGRDAAVYYGGYDLKFRNNTIAYLLVKAFSSNSTITVSIYGRGPKRNVEYRTSEYYDFVRPSTRTVKDVTMFVGTKKEEQSAEAGRSIRVKRSVSLGEKLLFKDTFFSKYSPKDSIIKVGVKPKPLPTGSVSPALRNGPTSAVTQD